VHLAALPFDNADSDSTFKTIREAGKDFGTALQSLLFEVNGDLKKLAMDYGVF